MASSPEAPQDDAHEVVLEARGVDFGYPSTPDFGLRGVDLQVRARRAVALMGFNAQGKSTLCKLLGHAPPAFKGDVAPRPTRGRVAFYHRASRAYDPHAASSSLASSAAIVTALAAGILAWLVDRGDHADFFRTTTTTTTTAATRVAKHHDHGPPLHRLASFLGGAAKHRGGVTAAALDAGDMTVAKTFSTQVVVVAACVSVCVVVAWWGLEAARRAYRDAWYRSRVVYVTTENDAAKRTLEDGWTIADGVTGHLRWTLSKAERLALAERLLTWAGFQHHVKKPAPDAAPRPGGGPDADDDAETTTRDAASVIAEGTLTCGELSGGQRHLVYFLRALAPIFALGELKTPPPEEPTGDASSSKQHKVFKPPRRASRLLGRALPLPGLPAVLLLDEAFNCFDAEVRPRALKLARHCVEAHGVACVVVTQVMHEVAVLCDDAVFVDAGRVVHRALGDGAARNLVAVTPPATAKKAGFGKTASSPPRRRDPVVHARCREYLEAYWSLERDMRAAAGRSTELAACGADLGAHIAALPALRYAGPPWEPAALGRGDRVRIVGLVAQQRYNAKEAVVLKRIVDVKVDGVAVGAVFPRFKVRLRDGQKLGVRRANLELLRRRGAHGGAAALVRTASEENLLVRTASEENLLVRNASDENLVRSASSQTLCAEEPPPAPPPPPKSPKKIKHAPSHRSTTTSTRHAEERKESASS